ncbi:hypothetical protein Asulf_00404 [Archaeoglobus sulfaticallidus PM70-1]|uniref:Uncharacterized protein n=1 Tax=Archaeoglobus sulfaticallidus PM70-1 TaxID=387631 RepID=N0BIY3_9EURY|nr:hypothetical protein [Archaeoglobus sulfaticallidus]AGK60431.1 hypothetical protein Asulf_00404 [Archaeoglobus sulfaticallidus PM70-1]
MEEEAREEVEDGTDMELILHLSNRCIETEAKKRYEELVRDLLKEDNTEKEKELELLVEFLKKANFSRLRKMGFDGNKEVRVRIRKAGEDFVVEEIDL